MKSLWVRSFGWLSIWVCLAVLPAWVIGGAGWGLAALCSGLALMLAWHLYHLGKLLDWQGGPLDAPLPDGYGFWEMAFAGLHRRVRLRQDQQRTLAETLERFMRVFRALPDGVIAFDRHQHIEWINARAATHFALSERNDRGQALTNLIRQPAFVTYLQDARFDEPLVYRDGRVEGLVLLLQIIPHGDDHHLLVSRDITQIERMETMRRDFVANVSHELKTPLTVIAGFSEMLTDNLEDYAATDVRHYLSLIGEQSERMRRLIQDLLTLSDLESGLAPVATDRIDIEPLLRKLQSEAQALSGGRHDIAVNIDDTAATLIGSTSEVHSAFGNLVGNAVRYTPPGGCIELSWRVCQGGGEFIVSDTGIGIAAEHLPRLTERFYRVDRSRSRETGGTGLGLAIVKHVLTRHQATLSIESELGHGSHFTVRFSAARIAT